MIVPVLDPKLGHWVYAEDEAAIPAAIILDHGDHTLCVPWATFDAAPTGPVFTLETLTPLTVTETIRCTMCDRVGWLHAGRWVTEEAAHG